MLSRLKAVAERRKQSLSDIFEEALREYLARQSVPDSVILSTQGILRTDPANLDQALNLDPYED